MNGTEALFHQPAAQAVGWALLHFVWQGAFVAAVTGGVLAVLHRSAADVRYVVATIGLALMLTLPIVTGVQKWQSLHEGPLATGPRSAATDIALPSDHASTAVHRTAAISASLGSDPKLGSDPSVVGSDPRALLGRVHVEPMVPGMLFVWLSGVTVLSLRLLTGWCWIQRMRTHGVTPACTSWQDMAARLARRLHVSRSITLLESTLVEVPTVVGWMKPVVLVPASALAGLSPDQLEAILAHELAHIRRHDYLVNLLQTVVETLLFYHPAVWWLSGRIRAERENCCDDLAVSLCGDPVAYASALADLEALRHSSSLALAATGGSLLLRVRRLLGAPASHAGRGPAWLAGTAAAILVGGLALGSDGLAQSPAAEPRPEAPVVSAPTPAQTTTKPATAASTRKAQEPTEADPLAAAVLASELAAQASTAVVSIPNVEPALASTQQALQVMAEAQSHAAAARVQLDDNQAVLAAQADSARDAARSLAVATPMGPILAGVQTTLETAQLAASQAVSISSHQNESSGNWVWSNNGEKLSISYSGNFELTDDDADVRQISAGGYLKISDQGIIGRHTVEMRERSGGVERRYYVNGIEKPFDPDGRQWLRDNLPKFVRNTGIGADRRVARYLKSGGPSAVMAEISRIDGSYAKRVYFAELFKQASLTPEQYRQAMAQAGREVKSDYDLASLLIAIADRLPTDEASRAAYFAAAGGIHSDYELRRVYSTMLKRGPVSSEVLAGILEHSSSIESDYEQSELLRQIVSQQGLDARTRAPFFRAAATVQSDYERHRILSAVASRPGNDAETLAAMLNQATAMGSDYEKASFLVDLLKNGSIEGAARAPFFTVANSINSSYERGRVLQTVLRKTDLSDDTLLAVLKSSGQMSSGYDRAQVLLLAASTRSLSGPLRDAYIDAADRLSSYEQGQVMTALVKSERRK
jgi:beta-lactamase regulating signal transducer with metallopeptidase domain